MKFKKAVPVIGILFLAAAGVGIAKESTSLSKPSTSPARLVSVSNPDLAEDTLDIKNEISRLEHRLKTLSSEKANNPDLKTDIAAIKTKIAKLRARLKTLRAEQPNPDLKADIAAIKTKIAKLRARLKTLRAEQPNPDLKADIAAVKTKIAKLRVRLKTLRAEQPNLDLKADIAAVKKKIALLRIRLREMRANLSDFDRTGRDLQDRESPEASLHHDGDDHQLDRGRLSALEGGPHREATREIMQGSHERIVALYAPAHEAGYHAKMHRHSR